MEPVYDVLCVASWNADLVWRVPRPITRGVMAHSFDIGPGGGCSHEPELCSPRSGNTRRAPRLSA